MWQAADQPKPFILSLSLAHSYFFLSNINSTICSCFPARAPANSPSLILSRSLTNRLQLYRWLQLHSLQISSTVFIQREEKWKGELLTPLFCFSPLSLSLLNFWRGFVLLGVRGRRCQTGNYVESVCLATFLPVGNVYLNSKLMIWIFVIHA